MARKLTLNQYVADRKRDAALREALRNGKPVPADINHKRAAFHLRRLAVIYANDAKAERASHNNVSAQWSENAANECLAIADAFDSETPVQ